MCLIIPSSTILQDILSYYESVSTVAVAYFYFDFNDRDKQKLENLLRSLIKQLLMRGQIIPDSLQKLYNQSNQPGFSQRFRISCSFS